MIKKIDHVGIAVKSIDKALRLYTDLYGLELAGIEVVEDQKVKTAFLPLGDSEIELLEATDANSAIAKFIEKKGEGIQHIAFRVENVEKALKQAKEKGIRLIDEKPRYGAGGAKIAFLHPKSTQGVLVEFCQRDE
ncbi:methylmalonyl-CoA epimerase [Garciella nitratireducens]|uniref:methylmalonyl-CoA epimerase n=1 Tax=Garciella nitratireducens TaxID=218205 RepID=UPI000DE88102|nr:methylmalonyl-CoA epimerase [Garciella nitratireducens]RBP38470.1 methylmalonyl-CoA epimerase [Garciella nitratireducens]